MKKKGLVPEQVSLPHDTEGYWIGNKTAKNVLVYYHGKPLAHLHPIHNLPNQIDQPESEKKLAYMNPKTGGGFSMAARISHIEFWIDLIKLLNDNGHDIAVFFLRYTLTPYGTYPTQLRQAVGGLRYILNETGRSPSDVILGGDSAGGNLAMATLLHISHPHPEIEPLKLSTPLAGVFGFAPWVNFSFDWPSMTQNAYKDICTIPWLKKQSDYYLAGKEGDNWSEPSKAPVEWWADSMTERILILAGGDEILLSAIEAFAKNIKVCCSALNWLMCGLRLICGFSLSFPIQLLLLAMMSPMTCISMLMLASRRGRILEMSCDDGLLLVFNCAVLSTTLESMLGSIM